MFFLSKTHLFPTTMGGQTSVQINVFTAVEDRDLFTTLYKNIIGRIKILPSCGGLDTGSYVRNILSDVYSGIIRTANIHATLQATRATDARWAPYVILYIKGEEDDFEKKIFAVPLERRFESSDACLAKCSTMLEELLQTTLTDELKEALTDY